MAGITLDVLGPTVIRRDGEPVGLRPRERDVLAALALRHPQPVSVLELSELLWTVPPASDTKTLQNHVARIRRELGAQMIRTVGSGYALDPSCQLDIVAFHTARAAASRSASVMDHRGAHLQLEHALRLVRGEPFADLEATAGVLSARRQCEQALGEAADAQLMALLRLGDVAASTATATGLPIGVREQRAVLVALAYYRGGRRLDALRTLHGCRQALRDAGLAPGEPLLRLERSLLADEPRLMSDDVSAFIDLAAATGVALGAAVLVGRERELEQLNALLSARFDRVDAAPAVVVCGPQGIGKSAVCARVALQARLSGWTVVETARLTPVEVIATIELSPDRPLLLVVEAADEYQPADWQQLAAAAGARTMLMATRQARPTGDVTTVELGPLSRDAVEQLIEVTVGVARGAAAPEVVDAVLAGSGGVPALVVELAIESGQQLSPSGLARRLVDGLGDTARAVAAMAAVATAPVRAATLLAACTRDGVHADEREVAECVARRVMLELDDGQLTCRDDELRAALMAGLGSDRVARARRAWIEQHDADGDAPIAIADHVAELPDWPEHDARARFDAATAAASSAVRYDVALLNARRAHSAALQALGGDDPDVLRREVDITGLMRLTLDMSYYDLQWALVDRLTAAGDTTNLLRLVGLMCSMGASSEAGALDARLVALVDEVFRLPADHAPRAVAAARATNFFALADGVRARWLAEIALADSAAADDEALRLFCIQCADLGLGHPDDWPRRVALGRESVALAERLDDDVDRASAMQLVFAGQVQFADPMCRATLDRMKAIARRLELPLLNWIEGYLRGALLHIEDRLDECEVHIGEIRSLVPLPASRLDAVYFGQLFAVRVGQGRIEEMAEPLERLVSEQPLFGLWRGFRAWTMATTDTARAARLLDELGDGADLSPDLGWAATMYSIARAAALVGDAERCERVLQRLSPYSGRMAWMGHGIVGPIDLAVAELQLAMGNADAAQQHLALAEQTVWRLHAPVFRPELAAFSASLDAAGQS